MLRTLTLALALGATAAQAQSPNRFISFDNTTWGYIQMLGDAPNRTDQLLEEGAGSGVRQGLRITILTRDGVPVTAADADDAWFAANEICQETRRQFDPQARAMLLRRGGLSFPGACG